MKEFYSNLSIVGTSLRSSVKEVKIDIHKDQFGRMFEPSFQGRTYTYEAPKELKKSRRSISIYSLIMNPMEDIKLPIKSRFLKPRVHASHYLLTRILFPRNINLIYVINDNIIPLWLLTKKFPIGWMNISSHDLIQRNSVSMTSIWSTNH